MFSKKKDKISDLESRVDGLAKKVEHNNDEIAELRRQISTLEKDNESYGQLFVEIEKWRRDLCSRIIEVIGAVPHPNESFFKDE